MLSLAWWNPGSALTTSVLQFLHLKWRCYSAHLQGDFMNHLDDMT